jgi:hypothetical protein
MVLRAERVERGAYGSTEYIDSLKIGSICSLTVSTRTFGCQDRWVISYSDVKLEMMCLRTVVYGLARLGGVYMLD